jgi:Uma2 family endonuclease
MILAMNIALPKRLTVDQFLAWAVRQTEGKYELVDGVVTMQQAQRWGHSKVKAAVYLALQRAVAAAGVACYVASDGPTVRMDTTTKLDGYFKIASVMHYLIVDPESRSITHHKRGRAGLKTRVVRKGVLALKPPGIEIGLSDLFAPAS